MKTAIVATDVQGFSYPAGGIASFVTHWSALLSAAGDQVLLVHVARRGETRPLDAAWQGTYESRGIDVVQVHAPFPSNRYPFAPDVRRSEDVAACVAGADVVYVQDRFGLAFHAVRSRRFRADKRPVWVTVLHGPSAWVRTAMWQYPEVPDDLNLDFVEQYAARHADFTVSPSRYILDWVLANGWHLPPEERRRILGFPMLQPAPMPTDPRPEPAGAGARRQIVSFGRIETRKGCEFLVQAIVQLAQTHPDSVRRLAKVVMLGSEADHSFKSASAIAQVLADAGVGLECITHKDSREAQQYLARHAATSLAVIASPFDNFPYTLIEASLVPGLDVVCSRGGGIPEVLGAAAAGASFDPHPRALADTLAERLLRPTPAFAAPYDVASANRAWLAFHEEVCAGAGHRTAPALRAARGENPEAPAVDVCVPHFNHAALLPQVLLSLEHQTCQDFTVIVIDDGSTDAEAQAVFGEMERRYAGRGWRFLRQPNAFVDAARNAAARHGHAEYLCFVDADDVAAPSMIERFLSAIRESGDDCLVSPSYLFKGDAFPYDLATGQIRAPADRFYMPLGASLVAGIIDPSVFGGPVFIIRRAVFEAIGGFTELRGVDQEDFELHLRLALAGYRTDVVPEYLQFYRDSPAGLSKTIEPSAGLQLRIAKVYESHLAAVGLGEAAVAFQRLYHQVQVLERRNPGRPTVR